jgi:hypothetical protein
MPLSMIFLISWASNVMKSWRHTFLKYPLHWCYEGQESQWIYDNFFVCKRCANLARMSSLFVSMVKIFHHTLTPKARDYLNGRNYYPSLLWHLQYDHPLNVMKFILNETCLAMTEQSYSLPFWSLHSNPYGGVTKLYFFEEAKHDYYSMMV